MLSFLPTHTHSPTLYTSKHFRSHLTHTLILSYTHLCVCSSQTEANQFTGMVYQGLLLSDRRRLRTESIEEHATPTSAPAQWPGTETFSVCVLCIHYLTYLDLRIL